ncbi:hypothetical protein ACOSQ4_003035 [Xanthoceras sorbifolium]
MTVSSCKIDAGISDDNAEAMAILSGIKLARNAGIYPVLVDSDSKVVVDLLNGLGRSRTSLGLLISRILEVSSSSQIISFSFSPRVCNVAAHALARLALSLDKDVVWIEETHDSLALILLADNQGAL